MGDTHPGRPVSDGWGQKARKIINKNKTQPTKKPYYIKLRRAKVS